MLLYHLMLALFLAFPVCSLLFFLFSLLSYLRLRAQEKKQPGSIPPEDRRKKKILLIIASCVAGTLLAVIIGLSVLLTFSIAYM